MDGDRVNDNEMLQIKIARYNELKTRMALIKSVYPDIYGKDTPDHFWKTYDAASSICACLTYKRKDIKTVVVEEGYEISIFKLKEYEVALEKYNICNEICERWLKDMVPQEQLASFQMPPIDYSKLEEKVNNASTLRGLEDLMREISKMKREALYEDQSKLDDVYDKVYEKYEKLDMTKEESNNVEIPRSMSKEETKLEEPLMFRGTELRHEIYVSEHLPDKTKERYNELQKRAALIKSIYPGVERFDDPYVPRSISDEYIALRSISHYLMYYDLIVLEDVEKYKTSDGYEIISSRAGAYEEYLGILNRAQKQNTKYITKEQEDKFEMPRVDIETIEKTMEGLNDDRMFKEAMKMNALMVNNGVLYEDAVALCKLDNRLCKKKFVLDDKEAIETAAREEFMRLKSKNKENSLLRRVIDRIKGKTSNETLMNEAYNSVMDANPELWERFKDNELGIGLSYNLDKYSQGGRGR